LLRDSESDLDSILRRRRTLQSGILEEDEELQIDEDKTGK
jgi:hypothetical protein